MNVEVRRAMALVHIGAEPVLAQHLARVPGAELRGLRQEADRLQRRAQAQVQQHA